MQLSIRELDDAITLIVLADDLDAAGAGQLRTCIDRLLADGKRRLIVDCTALTYASSAGIGALISVHRQVHAAGGRVLIAGAVGPVFEIIHLMNLGSILDLHPDAQQAERSLGRTTDSRRG
jgi:anti-anti-sigma factor